MADSTTHRKTLTSEGSWRISGEACVLSPRQKVRRWTWQSNLGPEYEGLKSVMPRKDLIFTLMVLTDFQDL